MGLRLAVVLRANVVLDSDVELAARELATLGGVPPLAVQELAPAIAQCLGCAADCRPAELLGRALPERPGAVRGFLLEDVSPDAFQRVVKRSAYSQEVFAWPGDHRAVPALTSGLADGYLAIALPALLETLDGMIPWLHRQSDRRLAIDGVVAYLLGQGAGPGLSTSQIDRALTRRGTLHLAHDLHVYKAKFFPRFVGALLNIYGPEEGGVMVEPFSGSGTALFEASIRGITSIGFDIDPISAMISACKVTPFTCEPDHLDALAASVLGSIDTAEMRSDFEHARLPDPIRERLLARDRREDTSFVEEIEVDAGLISAAIEPFTGADRLLLDTLFSDALTKKVRYRFVGVGNGRYTFAVTKQRLVARFRRKLLDISVMASILGWTTTHVQPMAPSSAQVGDACDLPLTSAAADVIVTSPPYLPASSGREHYALARAIPLALVGIGSELELDALNAKALGAVTSCDCPPDPILHAALEHLPGCALSEPSAVAEQDVPPLGAELLAFLAQDDQRRLKHRPTLEYFGALSQSTREAFRVLRPGGRLIIVLPRESIFYESQSRRTLFVCPAGELMAEIGQAAGFEVEDVIDMELLKFGTPNARPRASDAYYERAVVLRVPIEQAMAGVRSTLAEAA